MLGFVLALDADGNCHSNGLLCASPVARTVGVQRRADSLASKELHVPNGFIQHSPRERTEGRADPARSALLPFVSGVQP